MRKIVFVDSDGTLKNNEGYISQRTIDTIAKLEKRGIEVVVTTGRPRYHAVKVKKIAGASNFLISSNGAEIYDYASDKVIYVDPISTDKVIEITDIITNFGGRYALTIDNVEYSSDEAKNEHQVHIQSKLKSFLKDKKVKQIFVRIDDPIKAFELYDAITKVDDIKIVNESTFFKTKIIERKGIWFTITNKTVNKGKAIQILSELLNVDVDSTYGVGNDFNDLDMFRTVGHSIVMGNAHKDVKDEAEIVSKSNNNEGVAHILEKLFLKGE